jgi:hypothetical protein
MFKVYQVWRTDWQNKPVIYLKTCSTPEKADAYIDGLMKEKAEHGFNAGRRDYTIVEVEVE